MNGNGYNQIGTINLPSNGWLQLKITSHYFIKTNQDVSEPCSFMVGVFLVDSAQQEFTAVKCLIPITISKKRITKTYIYQVYLPSSL